MASEFTKDDSGNVIDPPVIADQEQKIQVASASGDADAIQIAQDAYDVARQEVIDRKDGRARDEERAVAEQEVSDRENRRREKSDAEGTWNAQNVPPAAPPAPSPPDASPPAAADPTPPADAAIVVPAGTDVSTSSGGNV